MAILVLGGAGYIGSHMVDRLVNEGQEKVVVVDSLVTRPPCSSASDAVFYQGDLADQDFMRRVFKEHADIDVVIHFAAYSLVAESMADPLKYFDNNNTAGMVKLLEVMHECGVHYIVFSSTAATYGIPEEIPILETTPQNRSILMEKSKLMMETIMRWADQAYGIKYVPLRYFNVAGAKARWIHRKTMDQRPISCRSSCKWPKANAKRSLFLEMTTRHQMAPMFGTMSIHLT